MVNISNYRHWLNGGCTTACLQIGFLHCKPPRYLTKIRRKLGDFLDYTVHPLTMVNVDLMEKSKFLVETSIPSVQELSKPVLLPTYKFSSGWGSRALTRKEKFNLWGYSCIEPTS